MAGPPAPAMSERRAHPELIRALAPAFAALDRRGRRRRRRRRRRGRRSRFRRWRRRRRRWWRGRRARPAEALANRQPELSRLADVVTKARTATPLAVERELRIGIEDVLHVRDQLKSAQPSEADRRIHERICRERERPYVCWNHA